MRRYGPNYGEVTGDTLTAIGQAVQTGHNVTSLGAKGIAKRAAKDTGKELLKRSVVNFYRNFHVFVRGQVHRYFSVLICVSATAQ